MKIHRTKNKETATSNVWKKIYRFLLYNDGKFSYKQMFLWLYMLMFCVYYVPLIIDRYTAKIEVLYVCDPSSCWIDILLNTSLSWILVILICILPNNYYTLIVKRILFLAILYKYGSSISRCGQIICILDPLTFPPVFFAFIMILRKTKYFYYYFLIFFCIPSFVIMVNEFIIYREMQQFNEKCENDYGNIEYNALYANSNYFHKNIKDGKEIVQANVVVLDKKDFLQILPNYKNSIIFYPYENCHPSNQNILKTLLKSNIVMCYPPTDYGYFSVSQIYESGNEVRRFSIVPFAEPYPMGYLANYIPFIKRYVIGCKNKISLNQVLEKFPVENYIIPISVE